MSALRAKLMAAFEGMAQRGALKLQRTIQAGDKSGQKSNGACSRYQLEPARDKLTVPRPGERQWDRLDDYRAASPDTA